MFFPSPLISIWGYIPRSSLLNVHLWTALVKDNKAGTYEPLSSLSIFIISATVIPQWGPMRQRCIRYFALYGYHGFFSFSAQQSHKLCPHGHYGAEQTRIDVSAQMSCLMSAFNPVNLIELYRKKEVDFTICKL